MKLFEAKNISKTVLDVVKTTTEYHRILNLAKSNGLNHNSRLIQIVESLDKLLAQSSNVKLDYTKGKFDQILSAFEQQTKGLKNLSDLTSSIKDEAKNKIEKFEALNKTYPTDKKLDLEPIDRYYKNKEIQIVLPIRAIVGKLQMNGIEIDFNIGKSLDSQVLPTYQKDSLIRDFKSAVSSVERAKIKLPTLSTKKDIDRLNNRIENLINKAKQSKLDLEKNHSLVISNSKPIISGSKVEIEFKLKSLVEIEAPKESEATKETKSKATKEKIVKMA